MAIIMDKVATLVIILKFITNVTQFIIHLHHTTPYPLESTVTNITTVCPFILALAKYTSVVVALFIPCQVLLYPTIHIITYIITSYNTSYTFLVDVVTVVVGRWHLYPLQVMALTHLAALMFLYVYSTAASVVSFVVLVSFLVFSLLPT